MPDAQEPVDLLTASQGRAETRLLAARALLVCPSSEGQSEARASAEKGRWSGWVGRGSDVAGKRHFIEAREERAETRRGETGADTGRAEREIFEALGDALEATAERARDVLAFIC